MSTESRIEKVKAWWAANPKKHGLVFVGIVIVIGIIGSLITGV